MGNSTSVGWVFSFCLITASYSFLNTSESENCGFWVYRETKSEQKIIQPVLGISKPLETQFFKYFRIRKPWVPGLLKEKNIRIKYLSVLRISKPLETRQFSQNNQKRTGRFLGGISSSPVSGFWRTMAVCEKQGVWFSESCGYAP